MKCLETRKTTEGLTRRRYLRDDGVRFSTIEVPVEVWRGVAPAKKVKQRREANDRARARDAVRMAALRLLADNWKPVAVADQLGVATRTVERWRRANKEKTNARA